MRRFGIFFALLGGSIGFACDNDSDQSGGDDRGDYQPGGKSDEFASCVGACGEQSTDGCWCDDECDAFGDCCPDKVDVCEASGAACGPVTCGAGEVCCNESCGICTAPGDFCTQQFCDDGDLGQQCGPNRCEAG